MTAHGEPIELAPSNATPTPSQPSHCRASGDLEWGDATPGSEPLKGDYQLKCFDITCEGVYKAVSGNWSEENLKDLEESAPRDEVRLVIAHVLKEDGADSLISGFGGNQTLHDIHQLLGRSSLFPKLLSYDYGPLWDKPHFRPFLRAPKNEFVKERDCVAVINTLVQHRGSSADPEPFAMMVSWTPCSDGRFIRISAPL